MEHTTRMVHFTIYDHPKDYPNEVVVRRWYIDPGKPVPDPVPWHIGKTIKEAQDSLPGGLHCIGRLPSDDPCIIETWI